VSRKSVAVEEKIVGELQVKGRLETSPAIAMVEWLGGSGQEVQQGRCGLPN